MFLPEGLSASFFVYGRELAFFLEMYDDEDWIRRDNNSLWGIVGYGETPCIISSNNPKKFELADPTPTKKYVITGISMFGEDTTVDKTYNFSISVYQSKTTTPTSGAKTRIFNAERIPSFDTLTHKHKTATIKQLLNITDLSELSNDEFDNFCNAWKLL